MKSALQSKPPLLETRLEFDRMTPPQAVALGFLLAGNSPASTAKKCGISVRTVFRWMETLDYRAHLDMAQRAAVSAGRTKLTASAHKAVETLVDALDPAKEIKQPQIVAACAILDRCGLSAKLKFEYESLEEALRRLPADELREMLEKRLETDGQLIEAKVEE